ncbi:MAG TPA: hypothetical protein VJH33_00960 [Candidatus Paceibacterota bacterium]
MSDEIQISGKTYISSKRAGDLTGYAQDYIGQLARGGAIDAQRIGGLWYIYLDSVLQHKKVSESYIPEPPKKHIAQDIKSIISLEGREYISASRASEITGYHQDYVGQLARSGKISSKQVGNRWYVDRHALEKHKAEKDSLLAAVQVESVGLKKIEQFDKTRGGNLISEEMYFKYSKDTDESIIPPLVERVRIQEAPILNGKEGEEHSIPIHIVMPRSQDSKVHSARPIAVGKKIISVRTPRKTILYASFTGIFLIVVLIFYGLVYKNDSFLYNIFFDNYITLMVKNSMRELVTNLPPPVDRVVIFLEDTLLPEIVYTSK